MGNKIRKAVITLVTELENKGFRKVRSLGQDFEWCKVGEGSFQVSCNGVGECKFWEVSLRLTPTSACEWYFGPLDPTSRTYPLPTFTGWVKVGDGMWVSDTGVPHP